MIEAEPGKLLDGLALEAEWPEPVEPDELVEAEAIEAAERSNAGRMTQEGGPVECPPGSAIRGPRTPLQRPLTTSLGQAVGNWPELCGPLRWLGRPGPGQAAAARPHVRR